MNSNDYLLESDGDEGDKAKVKELKTLFPS